jgi:phytoene dehydrogenase-like protein
VGGVVVSVDVRSLEMPDAVVIGAGPNGLVAANLLADRGWSVVVCEAEDRPGGAVKSSELIEPGFVNDEFSAFYPLAAASPVIRRMHLEDYGLRWRRSPLVLAHPSADGTCPYLSMDLDETVEGLNAIASGDGDEWRRLFDLYTRVRDGILTTLLSPFPPVRGTIGLLRALKPSELLRFARFATLPVRRLTEESFSSDAAARLLAGNALHADFPPETALGGFFGWILMALGQDEGFPVPEGGAGKLAEALVKRLEHRGGEVRCGAAVREVTVRGGAARGVVLRDGTEIDATRAVVADVTAPLLYLDLVGAEHLPHRLVDDLAHFHWDWATVKIDWTLDGPIPWEAEPARRAGTVHLGDSLDDLTIATAQLAAGRIPARPFVVLGQQSMTDPTRAPAGKETAWAYTHVPHHIRGDAGGDLTGSFDEGETEVFAKRVEDEIERRAPGFQKLIRGRHALSPAALEAANPALRLGAINGGTAQLHQQLVFRPTPGLGRAETPIKRLYLGSSSAHPGGGVHGAAGSNAARAALAHDALRRILPG